MPAQVLGFPSAISWKPSAFLNDVRKALRDTGGAKDEFRHALIDLQHLEIVLDQLNRGSWDHGGDAGHSKAIQGMALTCKVPLQEFLDKIIKYKTIRHGDISGIRARLGSDVRKVLWAVKMNEEVEKFRALIVAKLISINLLIQLYNV
jgi:hypothetical protein